MRWLILSLCCFTLPGCATLWTVLEVTHSDWQQGESARETPIGPAQQRVKVSAAWRPEAPPPPVAPVEAPPPAEPVPGVIDADPAPARADPGFLVPNGALGFQCKTEQRSEKVHVVKELYRYDGTWKALTAFMFIAEAAMAGATLWAGLNARSPAPVVVGAYAALDALGVAVLFWHPPETLHREYDGEGTWKTTAETCPAGLSVDTGEGAAPVGEDGAIGTVGHWALNTVLWSDAATLPVRGADGAVQQYDPNTDERCEWAQLGDAPRPWCRNRVVRTGSLRPTTELTFPPDAPKR